MQQMTIQGQIEQIDDVPGQAHAKTLKLRSANTSDPKAKEQSIDLRVYGEPFNELQVGQDFELDVRFPSSSSKR